MSQPQKPTGTSRPWSRQIQEKYGCRLSEDLVSWFDDGIWQHAQGDSENEFDSAVSPQSLLQDAPEEIWPALMPCHFLPMLSNQMGDYLCVRFAGDNSASEIVHWYHGGGDWIPWGNSLSEAILFDCYRNDLPGSERGHAVSAEPKSASNGAPGRLQHWASELSGLGRSAALDDVRGSELADAMLQHRLAESAVRCQLVIDAMENPLLDEGMIAKHVGLDNNLIQRLLFDQRLVEPNILEAICHAMGRSVDDVLAQQTWGVVRAHCESVTRSSPTLAWGWDLLGYASELAGEMEAALASYVRGTTCSIFTDQTVRMRTHGFCEDGQKFSAVRLKSLGYESDDALEQEYLALIGRSRSDDRRTAICSYFSRIAREAEAVDDTENAYRLWMRAGWDLGAEPMTSFAELLERTAANAENCGRLAQAQLARVHRSCFHARYGM